MRRRVASAGVVGELPRVRRWPRVVLWLVGAASLVLLVYGFGLYVVSSAGSKQLDLAVGLVTGGLISLLVFSAEACRERLALGRERRDSLRLTGAPPATDTIPAGAP